MSGVVSAALAGVVFGFGLALSGMANPAKVLNFLDVAGRWDPSLAFVMGGALLVTTPAFAWARRLPRPALGPRFELPTRRDLDGRLIGGAVLFGVGWGLVGFCPGPALASLAAGHAGSFIFVVAMIAGTLAARWVPAAPALEPAAPQGGRA